MIYFYLYPYIYLPLQLSLGAMTAKSSAQLVPCRRSTLVWTGRAPGGVSLKTLTYMTITGIFQWKKNYKQSFKKKLGSYYYIFQLSLNFNTLRRAGYKRISILNMQEINSKKILKPSPHIDIHCQSLGMGPAGIWGITDTSQGNGFVST